MMDVPTKIGEYNPLTDPNRLINSHLPSVGYRLRTLREETDYAQPVIIRDRHGSPRNVFPLSGQPSGFVVTYIAGGNLVDCKAYVDRLAAANQEGLYLRPTLPGSNVFFDDVCLGPPFNPIMTNYPSMIAEADSAPCFIRQGAHQNGVPHLCTGLEPGSNPIAFTTWGWNGGLGRGYALPGDPAFTFTFQGNAGWWLLTTVESFNGFKVFMPGENPEARHGNYYEHWFKPTAWGGTSYSNNPIAAVCHVTEPSFGVALLPEIAARWLLGLPFGDAVWIETGHTVFPESSATKQHWMAVGDPLVLAR
jgi:hypothetical protein